MSIDTQTTETVEPVVDAVDEQTAEDAALVEDELLVEEVSIDGMCGVY
jgi:mycofactocin precursor